MDQNLKSDQQVVRAESLSQSGSLVIEENTIYEIDQDCMNCLNKDNNSNRL